MKGVIAIDVGNTSTAIAVVNQRAVRDVRHCAGGLRDVDLVSDYLRKMSKQHHLAGAVMASVVPGVNRRWEKLVRQETGLELKVVTHRLNFNVGIDYPEPATIGADRLANACGAAMQYGVPVIVADFGTALTFDVVNRHGNYVGGVIAPGLPLMTDYLADRTALLPLISPKGPCGAVGRSTKGAMRIGARIGYRGMVREIFEYLTSDADQCGSVFCATGGFAKWVLDHAEIAVEVDSNLTLKGLGTIYDLNAERKHTDEQ